jgi:hypothetical protein
VAVNKVGQDYRASKWADASLSAEETRRPTAREEASRIDRQIKLRITTIVAVITPSRDRLKLESATNQATVLKIVIKIKWV